MNKLLVGKVSVSRIKAEQEKELNVAKRHAGFICGFVVREESADYWYYTTTNLCNLPRYQHMLTLVFDPALTHRQTKQRYSLKLQTGAES